MILYSLIMVMAGATSNQGFDASQTIVGRASVIDGDTIDIRGRRIRLNAIDAPEASQQCFRPDGVRWPCGRRASFALADYIGTANVSCVKLDEDRWGRAIARCSLRGRDLQEWMVSQGWALAFTRYSRIYTRNEQSAKQARNGMWTGTFQAPWDWRRDRDAPLYQVSTGPPE
jgi:endonuclease YncB( thermonuclease family)